MVIRSVLTLARSILPTPLLRSRSLPLKFPLPLAALKVPVPILESSAIKTFYISSNYPLKKCFILQFFTAVWIAVWLLSGQIKHSNTHFEPPIKKQSSSKSSTQKHQKHHAVNLHKGTGNSKKSNQYKSPVLINYIWICNSLCKHEEQFHQVLGYIL